MGDEGIYMDYIVKIAQPFVAYKGNEINQESIISALQTKCPAGYTVKDKHIGSVVFAKVVNKRLIDFFEPLCFKCDGNEQTSILTVSGYNYNKLELASECLGYRTSNYHAYNVMTNVMYNDYGTKIFKKVGEYMDYCSVIWDERDNSVIAGVTTPNDLYTHLYYGYTEHNHEIMFSNDRTILEQLCSEVEEMPENTYMKNGELYNFNDEKIKKETKPFIRKLVKKWPR